jgi:hypothetical protein
MQRPHLILLPSILLGFILAPTLANGDDGKSTDVCSAVTGLCQYTGPDAPVLRAHVCYTSSTGLLHLMGASGCPTGSGQYTLTYGAVTDPVTNEVQGFIPLTDACTVQGLCVDGPPPPDAQEHPMCCDEDYVCVDGASCGGTIYFCHDGVCNEDGTVTCFNGEPL